MKVGKRDDIYEIIVNNIKKERIKRSMTQAELALKSGYSHITIRKIEAKKVKKYFSIDTICNIADALDVEVSELLRK